MYNYKLTLCYDGGRYKGWQRQGNTANTIQARVEDALERAAGELRFELTGDGFLYNMVRIIVGTLIEVGAHSRAAEDMPAILASKDRERAGYTAPAQGLLLWQVRY